MSVVFDGYYGEILSTSMDSNMKKVLCICTLKELELQYGKKTLDDMIFTATMEVNTQARCSEVPCVGLE